MKHALILASLLTVCGAAPALADPADAAGHVARGAGHAIAQTGRATGHEAANLGREGGHAVAVTGRHIGHGVKHVFHRRRHDHH